jgi:hypothetical protein
MQINNKLLIRFWFNIDGKLGYGVTAYSLDDAILLLSEAVDDFDLTSSTVVENIDVSTLDQNHVIPNMGAPNFQGVWFPDLNL